MRPKINGPRDVPTLRRHLIEQWKHGVFGYPIAEAVPGPDGVAVNRTTLCKGEWDQLTLTDIDFSYYWVDTEMTDLVASAAETLPTDTILERELIPHRRGIIVFARPLDSLDAKYENNPIRVHAILWGPVQLPPWPGLHTEPQEALAMAAYQKLSLDDGLKPDEIQLLAEAGLIDDIISAQAPDAKPGEMVTVHGDVWVPLGRSDWVYGTRLDDEHAPFPAEAMASMIEDRRRVLSLWLLMAQEGITSTSTPQMTRGERRRAQRHGDPEPTVRIVSVQRHRSHAASENDGEKRHLTVRFLVSGHWRQQAVGPGRKERRPTWVRPHWRGPDDGPISGTENVRVWK